MVKGPGLYADIGKKARDLLYKDYQGDHKFTITTNTSAGVEMAQQAGGVAEGGVTSGGPSPGPVSKRKTTSKASSSKRVDLTASHKPCIFTIHPSAHSQDLDSAKMENSDSHRDASTISQAYMQEPLGIGLVKNPDIKNSAIQKGTASLDANQVKGTLPEGFFDNKDADLRARGITLIKHDVKDELKEFEKLIQEDLKEVDNRLEEEEIDAAETIEEAETLEQRTYRERVEILKKKKSELQAAKIVSGKGADVEAKKSSVEESSSDDDSDDDFAVDWRAKHL